MPDVLVHPPVSPRTRVLDAVIRSRWVVLTAVAVVAFIAHLAVRDWSWHFLTEGVRALFSPSGFDLYSRHPELQMGPLTFVLGAVFVLVLHGLVGTISGSVFMMLAGLLAVGSIAAFEPERDRVAALRWLVASALVLVVWAEVAVHWGHLDDAMALLGGVLAIRLARSGHPLFAALAVGLAIDFKPWAVPFAAVVLLAPRSRRVPALVILAATVLVVWGVFALLDPSMIAAARYVIPVDHASTIGLLRLAKDTPWWCRPAQLIGGAVLAGIAAKRGRWSAILLIAIALRMLLDPVAKNYYDSGLALAAAVFDVTTTVGLLPIATLVAFVAVYLPSYLLEGDAVARGTIRTVALLALLVAAWVRRPRGGDVDLLPSTTRPSSSGAMRWSRGARAGAAPSEGADPA